MSTPVTSLRSDSSLGKRPTTLVRFLIWPLTFSQALDVRRRFLWASGKAKTAKPSGRFSSAHAASLGWLSEWVFTKSLRRASTWEGSSALKWPGCPRRPWF